MFSTFGEVTPFLTVGTLVVCFLLVRSSGRDLFSSVDGAVAGLGLITGIGMTLMNHFYTSSALFLLSPTVAIGSAAYLHHRERLTETDPVSFINSADTPLFSLCRGIFFWVSILCLILSLRFAEPYTRPPVFFVITALGVAVLGLDIVYSSQDGWLKRSSIIGKTLVLSIILRSSAYFISSYPLGSDPWVHARYIQYFTQNGHLVVPDLFSQYYCFYPVSHVLAVISGLVAELDVKESLFIISIALALGTIFTYLMVRYVTGNEQIALFSLLLLNFFDAHIEWSVIVIAMSLGIVLYSFMLYLIFRSVDTREEHRLDYASILFLLMVLIIWTHTISSFIMLITFVSLYLSIYVYQTLYGRKEDQINSSFLLKAALFFAVLLAIKWSDPQYPFIEMTLKGLFSSLATEASFLGKVSYSNITGNWLQIYDVLGLIVYLFFGITGGLYYLSKKRATWPVFSLFTVAFVLFALRYAFPIMGLRDIIPDRWPVFAMLAFVLFVAVGMMLIISNITTRTSLPLVIMVILACTSFFMITGGFANMDSPEFGTGTVQKLIWPDSQMTLFGEVVSWYNGTITADTQTMLRPLEIYYNRANVTSYRLDETGSFDYSNLHDTLILWREESLSNPVGSRDKSYDTSFLLGDRFYHHLEDFFDCIGDCGTARAYI